MGIPPLPQTVTDKLDCVATAAKVDQHLVKFYGIDAVRNHHAVGKALEIMVVYGDGVVIYNFPSR